MLSRIKYQHKAGTDIPEAFGELTYGPRGLMLGWLTYYKGSIAAELAYRAGKPIGWCAYKVYEDFMWDMEHAEGKRVVAIDIGTFVSENERSKGLAKKLLTKALKQVKKKYPDAEIRYGAPYFHDSYNSTYEKAIKNAGLKPRRYY